MKQTTPTLIDSKFLSKMIISSIYFIKFLQSSSYILLEKQTEKVVLKDSQFDLLFYFSFLNYYTLKHFLHDLMDSFACS